MNESDNSLSLIEQQKLEPNKKEFSENPLLISLFVEKNFS